MLKKIVDMQKIDKVPPTIEDASVLAAIEKNVADYGFKNSMKPKL